MGNLEAIFPGGFKVQPLKNYSQANFDKEEEARRAIIDSGIAAPQDIYFKDGIAIDGKIHRFSTNGKPSNKDGWYVFFDEDFLAGAFGCWRGQVKADWHANIGRELSDSERRALHKRVGAAKKESEKKRKIAYDTAAIEALRIWGNAKPAPADHPYLIKKNILPNGSRLADDGRLIVPLFNKSGAIRSIQYIGLDSKRFLSGGETGGNFWLVGDVNASNTIYLAEGFATASTVNQVKQSACFISYSASNLAKVVPVLKELYPTKTIVIAADHDAHGVGEKCAEQCVQDHGCKMIIPPIKGDFNDWPQYLENDAEIQQEPPKPKHRFGFLKLSDLEVKPIDWVVKGFIEANTLGLIYGPPSVGKSFIGIDLACSIATNQDWHGHEVKQGAVFYVAGEGHNGIARRFKAWEKHNQTSLDNAPIYPSKCAIDLSDTAEVEHLIQTIHATGEHPSAVVIDTLARNYFGDENSSRDMGEFIKNVDRIRETWGCTVLIVHHSGKEADRGARGSTALRGAIDAEYSVVNLEGTVKMTCTKMKDAELPEPKYFEIQSVDLGLVDDDLNPITGAAIVECGKPATSAEEKSHKKLKEFKDHIESAWRESGSERVEGHPYISRDDFRDYFVKQCGVTVGSARTYLAPKSSGKPVCELIRAEVIKPHSDGWIVADSSMASAMILSKKADLKNRSHSELFQMAWMESGKSFKNDKPYLTKKKLTSYLVNHGVMDERLTDINCREDSQGGLVNSLLSEDVISSHGEGWLVSSKEVIEQYLTDCQVN